MSNQPSNHLRWALSLGLASALVVATGLPAAALSSDAQKIVAQVEKENPDIHPVCSDRTKLKAAITQATTELAKTSQLTEDPRAAGQEAGKHLYMNCPN